MSAIPSFGTFIQMSDASGANHATIGEVLDISGPKLKADTKETTSHSTGIPWKTRIATLLDSGGLTFDVNLDLSDPTHSKLSGLRKVFANRELRNFKVLYNSDMGSQEDVFDGYVTGLEVKAPVNGVYTSSVTIEGTGEVTLG